MKDVLLSSAIKVVEPRMAAVFSDPQRRRLVLLLAAKPRSLTELSTDTGLDLKRLHYHVTALQKLGLVLITETRARAGRAIKVYGALASSFFVPAGTGVDRTADRLMTELKHSLGNPRGRPGEGTLYHVTPSGEARMRAVRRPDARAAAASAVEHWRVLQLTRGEYLRLVKSIDGCLKEFARPRGVADKTYLVHFAIAPRTAHS